MKKLQEQIDQIMDEGEGKRRSVIVQMQPSVGMDERLLEVAAEVHRRRNLSLTARDLLPAPQQELAGLEEVAGKQITAKARRTLNSAESSLAVQVGLALLPVAQQFLLTSGLDALSPLLNSDVVKKALSETPGPRRSGQRRLTRQEEAPALSTSRSTVLSIDKDDLPRLTEDVPTILTEDVPTIQGIYPNRSLRVPHLVEVKNLPRRVQEARASSWGVSRINALSVWGAYDARGKGAKVAVLDTGVDAEHPDLQGKVTAWAEFDSDGRKIENSTPYDSGEHGTHCAGIVAGGNTSGRWIGVAPEAELAVALVLDGDRGGTEGQILAGIDWAIKQNVDVISMSLGGLTLDVEPPNPYTTSLFNAVVAGIPVVTAIGNEGSQTTSSPGNDWLTLSVGATDHRDYPAGFSGGRTHVVHESDYLSPESLPFIYSKPEVSAPGVAINSSVPNKRKKWAAFNGTSMATPHVAGTVALLLSATNIRDEVAWAQRAFLIQDLLTGSVEELGESGPDHRYGFGRIDTLRAIAFAKDAGY